MNIHFILLLLSTVAVVSTTHWSYKDNNYLKWSTMYPTCGGKRQSPINIDVKDVRQKPSLGKLSLTGYDAKINMKMTNNGHTAVVNGFTGDMYVADGGLSEKYILAQFHFHWGSSDNVGSEHNVDSSAFPMEVHFVHYKNSLGSLSKAVSQSQGLAVLGFLFEISDTNNTAFDNIVNNLRYISKPRNKVTLTPQALSDLMPSNLEDYYRYQGSLTTPPCSQTVVWTIFKQTIRISSQQLGAFRTLYSSENVKLEDNFRPVQALNGRKVESS